MSEEEKWVKGNAEIIWINLNFLISIFTYSLIHLKYEIALFIDKETEALREGGLEETGFGIQSITASS